MTRLVMPEKPNLAREFEVARAAPSRWIATIGGWIFAACVLFAAEPRRTILRVDVPGEIFGTAIAGLGEVNGDGYRDLLVAATATGRTTGAQGHLYVFAGSATGVVTEAISRLPMPSDEPIDACTLASVGDFDGDGRVDLLVGMPTYGRGDAKVGRLAWMRWSATVLPDVRVKSQEWIGFDRRLGGCLVAAGDVDGDGFPDALMTERIRNFITDRADVEAVHLLSGVIDADWTRPRASLIFTNERPSSAQKLFRLAAAGDTDGDGFADVLVGYSPRWSDASAGRSRRVELWRGGRWGFQPAPAWVLVPDEEESFLGADLCRVGNFGGYGGADLAVGEPGLGGNYGFTGRVHVVRARLKPGKLRPPRIALFTGRHAYDQFGATVTGLGDINGDGLDDLAVGAPGDDGGGPDAGRACVFLGRAGGEKDESQPDSKVRTPDWATSGTRTDHAFGSVITALGDLDRDGLADFAVASKSGNSAPGRVEVVYGSRDGFRTPVEPGVVHPLTIVTNAKDVVEVQAARRLRQRREAASRELSVRRDESPIQKGAESRVVTFLLGVALGMLGLWWVIRWQVRRRRAADAAEERRRESEHFGQTVQQLLVGDFAGAAELPGPLAALVLREGLKTLAWSESPDNDSLESVVQFLGQQAERFTARVTPPLRLRLALPLDVAEIALGSEWRHRFAVAVKSAWIEVLRTGEGTEVRLEFQADPKRVRVILEMYRASVPTEPESIVIQEFPLARRSLDDAKLGLFRSAGGQWNWESTPGGGARVVIECPLPAAGDGSGTVGMA